MFDMLSPYFFERYAQEHHSDLMAEAEKARLIKKASVHLPARHASRSWAVQFELRSILTGLPGCALICQVEP